MANGTVKQSRTVCQSCDLPYYASKGACPYCATTGGSETKAGGSGTGQGDIHGESPPGLLARLKSALGI
jgi:hypothetical protein